MTTPASADEPQHAAEAPPVPVIRISCRRCRGRKLKCDRATPRCTRCAKSDEECVYPGSRKSHVGKRAQVRDLEAKLGQLENKLNTIGAVEQPNSNEFGNLASTSSFDPFLPSEDVFGSLPIHTHTATEQPTPPYIDGPAQTELISLGLFEQLPAIELIEELTAIYFDELHHASPMLHRDRYIASLYLPPHMRPPMCLQYIVMASAARISSVHRQLALPFYQRSRAYAESDEMRGEGEYFMTIAHTQFWILCANFEARQTMFSRAGVSIGRSVRIAQLINLHQVDRKAQQGRATLAPARDWTETEERRRTWWVVFCTDRLMDVLLPASEEAFESGIQEKTTLPDTLRLPRNIRSPNAVFVNLITQAAIISLHRAAQWVMRPLRNKLPEHTIRQSHSRLIPAAEEILHVFRMIPDLEATLQNAMVTFAAYMAALVFLEDFAAEHSQQSESNMDFLVGVLVAVGRGNAMVASLANQLAIDMYHLGIKSAVADKVICYPALLWPKHRVSELMC
ncbi:hypothetical protein ACHAQA_005749 [Verticillium albo-atrum]